jgi:hypothetical protein
VGTAVDAFGAVDIVKNNEGLPAMTKIMAKK